ncbi:MAG: hypothetical protein QXL51_04495 [Candidatus Aenigmatarchaeota archaeon]
MHKLIGFIVDAEDEEDAVIEVENLLKEDFVGEGRYYDYYTLFDNQKTRDRYGKLPVTMLITSDAGKKFMQEQLKATKDAIKEAINSLKEAVNKNIDLDDYHQLLELLKKASNLSLTDCMHLFSVTNNDGILTDKQLDDILNEKLESGKKRFVVPVDLHF